ncbi:hypothetical protein Bbelb_056540 [Branchiostoma belcheri]|nr:hypothetical protein Bbelb_056540 [Branchiostoma belcheri]
MSPFTPSDRNVFSTLLLRKILPAKRFLTPEIVSQNPAVTARHCDSQAAAIIVTFDLTGGPSIIKGEGFEPTTDNRRTGGIILNIGEAMGSDVGLSRAGQVVCSPGVRILPGRLAPSPD